MKDKLSVCCRALIINKFCSECSEPAKPIEEKDELDMSTCNDLVEDTNKDYEDSRYTEAADDRSWAY